MTQNDLIYAIGNALPAASYAEIVGRVRTATGASVSYQDVAWAISRLRRHAEQYGWTIPHSRRGNTLPGEDRFFMLLVDRAGDFFVVDDERREQLHVGASDVLNTTAQTMKNIGTSLEMATAYERSPAMKRALNNILTDVKYLSEKAAQLAEQVAV